MGATVWIRGETLKAASETAVLWQPWWDENETVLSTAIHTPERDTGPVEGAAGSRWFIEIVEKSLAVVCCLLVSDKLMGCSNEEIVWEKPVQVVQAAMGGRWHCWVMYRGFEPWGQPLSPHMPASQLKRKDVGPSSTWITEPQSKTPPRERP